MISLSDQRAQRFDALFGSERTPSQRVDASTASPALYLVLADGETYTGIHGCLVALLPNDYLDEHEDFDAQDDHEMVVAHFIYEAPYLDAAELPQTKRGFYLTAVLNDGETLSTLSGCTVVAVPDDYEGDDPIEEGAGRVLRSF
jgi:hypothetical protein